MRSETQPETGIWYGSIFGVRSSEVPLVHRAAINLGGLTVRVVEDRDEAQRIVTDETLKRDRERFADLWTEDQLLGLPEKAAQDATRFVANMRPTDDNSHDPLLMVWIERTEGSTPVLPHEIHEEIQSRVRPAMMREPVSVDEVLYGALNPIDPQSLLA